MMFVCEFCIFVHESQVYYKTGQRAGKEKIDELKFCSHYTWFININIYIYIYALAYHGSIAEYKLNTVHSLWAAGVYWPSGRVEVG